MQKRLCIASPPINYLLLYVKIMKIYITKPIVSFYLGLGVSVVLLSVVTVWHQVVSMAWALVYFFKSFSSTTWESVYLPLDNLCVHPPGMNLHDPQGLCINTTATIASNYISTTSYLSDYLTTVSPNTSSIDSLSQNSQKIPAGEDMNQFLMWR